MNKILWIMTKNKEESLSLQNRLVIELLKKGEIIAYGNIDASNHDDFFNDDNSFWILVNENSDFLDILEFLSTKGNAPIISRIDNIFYCFDSNGIRYDDGNWTKNEALQIIDNNWDFTNILNSSENFKSSIEGSYAQKLDKIFVDETEDEKINSFDPIKNDWLNQINLDSEFVEDKKDNKKPGGCGSDNCACKRNEQINNGNQNNQLSADDDEDYFGFGINEINNELCETCDCNPCLCETDTNSSNILSIDRLCENCFSSNCSCDVNESSNLSANDSRNENQMESSCLSKSCESCTGCNWDVDSDLDDFVSDNNNSHHFSCVCEDECENDCQQESISENNKNDFMDEFVINKQQNSVLFSDNSVEQKLDIENKIADNDINNSCTNNQIIDNEAITKYNPINVKYDEQIVKVMKPNDDLFNKTIEQELNDLNILNNINEHNNLNINETHTNLYNGELDKLNLSLESDISNPENELHGLNLSFETEHLNSNDNLNQQQSISEIDDLNLNINEQLNDDVYTTNIDSILSDDKFDLKDFTSDLDILEQEKQQNETNGEIHNGTDLEIKPLTNEMEYLFDATSDSNNLKEEIEIVDCDNSTTKSHDNNELIEELKNIDLLLDNGNEFDKTDTQDIEQLFDNIQEFISNNKNFDTIIEQKDSDELNDFVEKEILGIEQKDFINTEELNLLIEKYENNLHNFEQKEINNQTIVGLDDKPNVVISNEPFIVETNNFESNNQNNQNVNENILDEKLMQINDEGYENKIHLSNDIVSPTDNHIHFSHELNVSTPDYPVVSIEFDNNPHTNINAQELNVDQNLIPTDIKEETLVQFIDEQNTQPSTSTFDTSINNDEIKLSFDQINQYKSIYENMDEANEIDANFNQKVDLNELDQYPGLATIKDDEYVVQEQQTNNFDFIDNYNDQNNSENLTEQNNLNESIKNIKLDTSREKIISDKSIAKNLKLFLAELQREKERLRRKKAEIEKTNKRVRMLLSRDRDDPTNMN